MDARTLTRLPIFEGCSEEAARQLLAEAPNSVRRYPTPTFIAHQADTCRSLKILCSGTVRAQMESAEGKLLTIEIMKAPEVLAPAFIYAAENRFPVHIETLEPCEVFLMDKNRFLQFMHQYPVVMQNFLREISDRSQFLSKKLNEFALQSLKSRLLNYLQIHKRIRNQQEVAFILGLDRPSLARTLAELIAEGKISMEGKEVVILK